MVRPEQPSRLGQPGVRLPRRAACATCSVCSYSGQSLYVRQPRLDLCKGDIDTVDSHGADLPPVSAHRRAVRDRVTTEGKAAWRYGRIEVRAKLPEGRGMWPAIWMLGVNRREAGWPRLLLSCSAPQH